MRRSWWPTRPLGWLSVSLPMTGNYQRRSRRFTAARVMFDKQKVIMASSLAPADIIINNK